MEYRISKEEIEVVMNALAQYPYAQVFMAMDALRAATQRPIEPTVEGKKGKKDKKGEG